MLLREIQLTNFRSYPDNQFKLGEAITLIVGPNASGKTNLLEGIYAAATTKSFRAKDREMIRHGEDFYKIELSDDSDKYTLSFQDRNGQTEKKVTQNKVKKSLTQHIGRIQAVLFEPNDLHLVTGPPDRRRRYLDYILCQTDPGYLKQLIGYRRILRQRNKLLEEFGIGQIKDQIFAWDLQLTGLAAEIYRRRQELINHINQLGDDVYREISGHQAGFSLEYLPSVEGTYADNFMEALAGNLTRDLAAGFTTIGPHREDFKLNFNDKEMTAVASRGEIRTAVLVLKLAELAFCERASGSKPVLLLDDVFSELDSSRRRYLLKKLEGYQSLITTTDADAVTGDIAEYHLIETRDIYARKT